MGGAAGFPQRSLRAAQPAPKTPARLAVAVPAVKTRTALELYLNPGGGNPIQDARLHFLPTTHLL